MIEHRIEQIKDRIRKSAIASGRNPSSIRLLAASKSVSPDRIRSAIDSGLEIFGENYIQEAIPKIEALSNCPVHWHFIGHLQSKKAKYAVRHFELIHSVDSTKLAEAIDKEAKKLNKIQEILIQVNISGEESKSGVTGDDAISLVKSISRFENICIKGLMTMPPYDGCPEKSRPFFKALHELSRLIHKQSIPGVFMDELSMGMTGDFETAIEEGATLLRIGTAIFGERQ